MLQKKIDGERLEIPALGKHGFSPWYGNEVERDIPVPVLGPDLIDLRTVEIAAERTAMGLLDQHEAGLEKPAKIPAPQPEPQAEAAPSEPAATTPKAMSKIDMIRARRGARQWTDTPPPAAATETKPAPAPKAGKKIKRAEARPTPRLAGRRQAQRACRTINAEVGTGAVSIVHAGLLVQPDKLIDIALYLRDKNPIKYDYLASLQSVHYDDCIEVNYQLDSTAQPGTLIELRRASRRGRGTRRSTLSLSRVSWSRLPGARSLRHDGRPL